VNEHVRMMRRLREKFNEGGSKVSNGWLSRIVNRDVDGRDFNLRGRPYDMDDLLSHGVTACDFLLSQVSWATMRRLGYTLSDASMLGFTTDDLVSLGISNDDLLSDRTYVVANDGGKQLLQAVCSTREDASRWLPSELFRLGFTSSDLVNSFGFSASEVNSEAFSQYFEAVVDIVEPEKQHADTWQSARIAGPQDVRALPDLKIDMRSLC